MRYTSFWETYFPLPGRYTSQNKVYFISNPASAAYNNSTSRSYQIYESIVPDTHQTDGRRTQTGADGVSLFPPSSSDWSGVMIRLAVHRIQFPVPGKLPMPNETLLRDSAVLALRDYANWFCLEVRTTRVFAMSTG